MGYVGRGIKKQVIVRVFRGQTRRGPRLARGDRSDPATLDLRSLQWWGCGEREGEGDNA